MGMLGHSRSLDYTVAHIVNMYHCHSEPSSASQALRCTSSFPDLTWTKKKSPKPLQELGDTTGRDM